MKSVKRVSFSLAARLGGSPPQQSMEDLTIGEDLTLQIGVYLRVAAAQSQTLRPLELLEKVQELGSLSNLRRRIVGRGCGRLLFFEGHAAHGELRRWSVRHRYRRRPRRRIWRWRTVRIIALYSILPNGWPLQRWRVRPGEDDAIAVHRAWTVAFWSTSMRVELSTYASNITSMLPTDAQAVVAAMSRGRLFLKRPI